MSRHTWFIQIAIVMMSVAAYFVGHGNWVNAVALLITMEAGSIFGRLWGARLRRRIQQHRLLPPVITR